MCLCSYVVNFNAFILNYFALYYPDFLVRITPESLLIYDLLSCGKGIICRVHKVSIVIAISKGLSKKFLLTRSGICHCAVL